LQTPSTPTTARSSETTRPNTPCSLSCCRRKRHGVRRERGCGGLGKNVNNSVYTLNATTGAKLWNYTSGGGVESPAVANGVVYVGSEDGNVYAIGTE